MRDISDFVFTQFDYYTDNGSDYAVDCPFCDERVGKYDTKQHLQINQHREICHCFRCDYANNWIGLITDITGCNYVQALGKLYKVPKPVMDGIADRLTTSSKACTIRSAEFIFPSGYKPIYAGCASDSQAIPYAKTYLRKRGFGVSYWKKYHLGVCENRVLIPIEGDFWQTRAIFSFQQPKYMSPSTDARDVLFNAPALDMYDEIVVCEGAFSAMAVGDNAVALIGKNPVREKMLRLVRSNVKRFIIVVEYKADAQMMHLADVLYNHGKDVELWHYADNVDPADWMSPYKVQEYDFKQKLEAMLAY